jgi:hypothetical protein
MGRDRQNDIANPVSECMQMLVPDFHRKEFLTETHVRFGSTIDPFAKQRI